MFFSFELFHTLMETMDMIDNIREVLEPLLEDRACRTLDGRVEHLHHHFNSMWKPFDGELTVDQKFEAFNELELMLTESEKFARLAAGAGRYDLVGKMRRLQQSIRNSSVYQEIDEDGVEMVRQQHQTFRTQETFSERVADCGTIVTVPDEREFTYVRGRKLFATTPGAARTTIEARTAALAGVLGRNAHGFMQYAA